MNRRYLNTLAALGIALTILLLPFDMIAHAEDDQEENEETITSFGRHTEEVEEDEAEPQVYIPPWEYVGEEVAECENAPIYRVYLPDTHEHLYTSDHHEYRLLSEECGWEAEGMAWCAPVTGTPVYRLFNPHSGDHLYTKDEYEYNMLAIWGWRQEGVCWYSLDENGGVLERVPVYRLYLPGAETGAHLYTQDVNERNQLLEAGTWIEEGVAWYAAYPLEDESE